MDSCMYSFDARPLGPNLGRLPEATSIDIPDVRYHGGDKTV